MPPVQSGQVDFYRDAWRARWYDVARKERQKRGFRTKTEARRWVNAEVDRVERMRRGDRVVLSGNEVPTLEDLAREFFSQYTAEPNTVRSLRERAKYATDTFGEIRINRLTMPMIAAWRKKLPERSAWHIHKALRQILNYAVAADYVSENIARKVANPEPKRPEVVFFEHEEDVEKVGEACVDCYRAIPVFAAATGLRPEEWIALEKRDVEIDRRKLRGCVNVRRVFTAGVLKPFGKQQRSLRVVPLTSWAVEALVAMTPRIDSKLQFPALAGGHIDLHSWRRDHWRPAVTAAGLDVDEDGADLKRTPYTLRHTFAAWAIAARMDTYTLARRLGTSVEQIDKTYGHLVPGSVDAEIELLERGRAERTRRRKAQNDG
jgi:integrase